MEKQLNNANWNVNVLADRWVQRWVITANGNEQFLFEDFEIFRKIRDAFHQKLWSNRGRVPLKNNYYICN